MMAPNAKLIWISGSVGMIFFSQSHALSILSLHFLTTFFCHVLSYHLLHGLHNQISSSTHLSVVRGHIEFQGSSWRVTVSKGPQVLSFNSYQEGLPRFLWSSWKVTMSRGPQVLSSNGYLEGCLLWRVTTRAMSLGETLVEQLSKRLLLPGGQPHCCQKSVGTWDKWESRRRD